MSNGVPFSTATISVHHSAQRAAFHFVLLPRRRSHSRGGLENGRVPTSTMPRSRRRAWPISTFQLLKLKRESHADTVRVSLTIDGARKERARGRFRSATRARDGCDGLLTEASLTSRGGIRDWSLCSRAVTKADTGVYIDYAQ